MTDKSLDELERDVEATRAQLAGDLAALRSPATFNEFSGALKLEARDLKRSAMSTVRERAMNYVDDLKARAAENPAAVLAIGAGVAWRLLHKPPITTALVGAGLYSLLRTPDDQMQRDDDDYLGRAKVRLREQAADLGETIKSRAAGVGETVAARSSELIDTAKTAVVGGADGLSEKTSEMLASSQDAAQTAATAAVRAVRGYSTSASNLAGDNKDQLLLGAAGVAVVAALAIAFRRRLDV